MTITSRVRLETPLPGGLSFTVAQAPGGDFSHDGDLYYGWDFAAATDAATRNLDVLPWRMERISSRSLSPVMPPIRMTEAPKIRVRSKAKISRNF